MAHYLSPAPPLASLGAAPSIPGEKTLGWAPPDRDARVGCVTRQQDDWVLGRTYSNLIAAQTDQSLLESEIGPDWRFFAPIEQPQLAASA